MTDLHIARRRSISVLKNQAPMLVTALLVALILLPRTPALADHFGGPVILTGIDAEDCGPDQHGPIGTWVAVVQNGILNNTSNGGDGILVIGANGLEVKAFWNAIGAGTGETVTFGDEKSSLAGFQMIAIVGSFGNTCSGLTGAQNTALTSRAAEFAAFVNGGGGLFASDQSTFRDRFGFVGGAGAFTQTIRGYSAIDPTPEGLAVGVNDSLDGAHWHFIFTKFPDFLKPLAYRAGTLEVAAIGGAQVMFPVSPGGEFPPHPPPPPPPPPPSPSLLGSVTALVNPGPTPTPSPTPSLRPDPSPTADAPAVADTTPPRDGATGAVPIGGVKAGGGGTASGSGGRTAAIMLVLLAAVAHVVVFVRRKGRAA